MNPLEKHETYNTPESFTFKFVKGEDLNLIDLKVSFLRTSEEPKDLYNSLTVTSGLVKVFRCFPLDTEIIISKEYIRKEFLNCYIADSSWTNARFK
jgi:hypothetical protein